ncbi:C-C chemokine receptor type 1-like [Engraulis encrasicolus]|uniref:C-C chemokine receptor type 1-like n=1 Tax=Engraulis encrasicolus TaxID=184585 RepID=UPI002FD3EE21
MNDTEGFISTTPFDYSDYDTGPPVTACVKTNVLDFSREFLPPFYYIIFTLSLLGNGLVLFVVVKFERVRTVTNIFLVNLVGSNLVFTCVLPFWAAYHSDEWTFGTPLCKLVGTATYVGFHSSVLFLTLVTIDRYLAVVHAVAVSQHRKSCYAVVASGVVWLTCGLAGVRPLLHYKVSKHWENNLQCKDELHFSWKPFDIYVHFVAFFLIPLLIVGYCYVRIIITVASTKISGKHRTLRIVFVILLLFFACWTPRSIMQLVAQHTRYDCNDAVDYANYITNNIACLYFSINPVLYTFLGRKFQNYVRELIGAYVPCLKSHLSVAVTSKSQSHRSHHSSDNQGDTAATALTTTSVNV